MAWERSVKPSLRHGWFDSSAWHARFCKVANYQCEQMRVYMQERRARIRAEMVARLGGHCAWCPSTDDLQFDHKDPTTKLFAIASGLDRPRGVLLAEVDKCQLLCGPHHVEKTADDEPYPNRARGERHGQAKLTAIDVADMRSANGVSGSVLADAFGVSKTQVNRIRAGKYWRHL
jgi:5-methylcytosine-specific restriction endonuclease McrA